MNLVPIEPVAEFALHLADNALILGQRNAEWCGHGPILEEDLALANNSLDLIGQARLLYQHVAELRQDGTDEDSLAYFRNESDFLNCTMMELPHSTALTPTSKADRDYAVTIARNFLYSAWMVLLWDMLQAAQDPQLAAIASKSLKEVRYHFQHARDWLLRFGDGTPESHARAQAAINHLMPYTQEFWSDSNMVEQGLKSLGLPAMISLKPQWDASVAQTMAEATLSLPAQRGQVTQGKHGVHSEHMGFVLAEMQSLARQHPGASW